MSDKRNRNKKIILGAITLFTVIAGVFIYIYNREYTIEEVPREDFISVAADDKRYTAVISDEVKKETDIIYASAGNEKMQTEDLKLDVYMPVTDTEENRPAIIFIHGGGLTSGDKATDQMTQSLAIDFAKMGYVTFNVNYRLREKSSQSALEDAMADISNAFTWIQENSSTYGVDKNHIALAGYSSGAVIAVNLCYSNRDSYPIDRDGIFGVVDLAGGRLYFGSPKQGNPACLIMHGTLDTTADYNESKELADELTENHVVTSLYSLEGLNHVLSSRYDEIRNQIGSFLYKELTGQSVTINIESEVSLEYLKVEERLKNGPFYQAQQVDCILDGKLDEWGDSQVISLNQLKDAGTSLPGTDDFQGTVMVGWNEENPSCIYIAAEIVDDIIQDINAADGKWYLDDCLEIVFDLSTNQYDEQLMKWVIGANTEELSVLAAKENTQVVLNQEDHTYNYEMEIDLSKIEGNVLQSGRKFSITTDEVIGFSIAYNDGEHQEREHQIGWTSGKSSDRATLGNLTFVEE